ncbi:MAG: hypothetical protein FWD83_07615 [Promicromonosporaceae bacterium]|nr:hypothetical protein [Promicromonosporaceae bacterium]
MRDRLLRRALLAGGLALGLVTGGGLAYGYWTLSGTTDGPGVLLSGYYGLQVTTSNGTQYDGTTFSLPATDPLVTTTFLPGGSGATVLTLTSLSSISMPITIGVTFGGSAASSFTVGSIVHGAAATQNNGICSTGAVLAPGGAITLAAGATTQVCIQVTMTANAPDPGAGQGTALAGVTIAFDSIQPQPGS